MRKAVLSMMILLLVSACAFAQGPITARYRAMGQTFLTIANDSAAVMNPANLARLDSPEGPNGGDENISMASRTLEMAGDTDYVGLHAANSNGSYGIGYSRGEVGWSGDYVDLRTFGVGAGTSQDTFSASLGVSAQQIIGQATPGPGGTERLYSAGFVFGRNDTPALRAGILAEDLTDKTGIGPVFDVGLSARLPTGTLGAVDVLDVTDEAERLINFGVEQSISENHAIRAGLMDSGDEHLLTFGFGVGSGNWQADIAWGDMPEPAQDQAMVTFSHRF